MRNSEVQSKSFTQNISLAAESLQSYDYDKAHDLIVEAMYIEPDAPQPHNLLGIFYELIGDVNMACKHYRAAYSLDPTYKPACRNLEQISGALGSYKPRVFDFGDEAENSVCTLTNDCGRI